ncbi:MAG: hypothetical protein HND47_06670 [Chloroflexi bacterium]|nr:hypothetical protein [Chloroflexota bacterium]
MTSDPTRGGAALVIHAALHEFHRLEVTARFVRCAAGMDDGELSALPGFKQGTQIWMKAKETVQVYGSFFFHLS